MRSDSSDEQLTNELAHVQAELQQARDDFSEFAYRISHDLREPARGIRNYATFLLEDYASVLDDEGRSQLQALPRLADRIDAMLDGLRDYAHACRVDLALAPVSLEGLADRVASSTAVIGGSWSADVRIAQPLPVLECDAALLETALGHVLKNAMQYHDPQTTEAKVEIGYRAPTDTDEKGALYVQDNGIGIPEEKHEDVFVMFRRLHARDAFGGGAGAGLTNARRIIQRHDGRLWIESTPEVGTTVFMTLRSAA